MTSHSFSPCFSAPSFHGDRLTQRKPTPFMWKVPSGLRGFSPCLNHERTSLKLRTLAESWSCSNRANRLTHPRSDGWKLVSSICSMLPMYGKWGCFYSILSTTSHGPSHASTAFFQWPPGYANVSGQQWYPNLQHLQETTSSSGP